MPDENDIVPGPAAAAKPPRAPRASRPMTPDANSGESPVVHAAVAQTMLVQNKNTGRWEEIEFDASAPSDDLSKYAPQHDEDVDLCDITREWAASPRSALFEFKWVHMDPRHHARLRGLGYAPVDPDKFVMSRYPVRDIAGVGRVYYFMDIILFEIPRALAEQRRLATELAEKEKLRDRYDNTAANLAGTIEQYGDRASAITHTYGEGRQKELLHFDRLEQKGGVVQDHYAQMQAEIGSFHKALDDMQRLSGRPPMVLAHR